MRVVALRKESVDRNVLTLNYTIGHPSSLSARRAWIEIPVVPAELTKLVNVALRKESVDRNSSVVRLCSITLGRSPQGERG